MPPRPQQELPGTGLHVSRIALDGSLFGWVVGSEHATEVLDAFADAGGNLISTADHYAGGRSEIMIGRWLRSKRLRDSVLIATKIGRHPDNEGLSAASIVQAAEASLERLGTEYIDILSFDGHDPEVPLAETLEAADRLVQSGKVRCLGQSGWSAGQLESAVEAAKTTGVAGIRVALARYSLLEREFVERELAPVAGRLGIGLLARLPLADGYLAAALGDDAETERELVAYSGAKHHLARRDRHVLAAVEAVASGHDQPVGTIALAWVLNRPEVCAAVVRARRAAHLAELLPALDIRLTRHEAALLSDASA